jgi:hypothetical protein
MARFFGPGSMRDLHGRTTRWNGITCLAMYHPAAILRTNTPEMRRAYLDDFRKIPSLLAEARHARAAARAELVAQQSAAAAELDQLPLF